MILDSLIVWIWQIPVKDLVERSSQQIGQAQWDFTGHGHQVSKARHSWTPWSNQNDPVAQVVLQLIHNFAQGGDQWEGTWIQILQDRLSASTAQARGSGTGKKNVVACCLIWLQTSTLEGLVPLGAYCLEDRWMEEGPFWLDGLT